MHDEGYIDLTDLGQLDQRNYHIKDHLGNVRVVIQDYYNSHLITQVSTYYPFGIVMQPERFVNSQEETDNAYLYNGKEVQEMPGGWYDYGARFYDAQLGRWHAVDPMAEDYFDMSPFNYVANNPLKFIDPNGMNLDEYGVNNNGDVKFLKQKEGPDELYKIDDKGNKVDVDGDGKMTEGKDFIKVNDKDVLPELESDQPEYAGDYAESSSLEDIGNVFLFAAQNTNKEWSFSAFNNNGEKNFVVNTSHKVASVKNITKSDKFNELNKTFSLHSHPSPNGTPGASVSSAQRDDMDNYRDFARRWHKAGKDMSKFPIHGIYHKETRTIYYYNYYKSSIKGHTFK